MSPPTKRIIGLTGGIACGKSTVSKYLAQQHHCIILDADEYARIAVSKTSPLLQKIHARYGDEIITPGQELDRAKLGQIVFNNDQERQWLEQLIHPDIRTQFEQERTRYLEATSPFPLNSSILVMVIPLLFESQMEDLVTEIWVVSCSLSQQRQRLVSRNGLSIEQADARILSQWPLDEKIRRASVELKNTGDRHQLYPQIDAAIQHSPQNNSSKN